ncbi:MAG: SMP-30/gluconolactonase/LRE family protein [Pirellulaceae bacterium]|nr:SMP-30/gluconolactonase/LRE family protein [Pirellulaceae bacterium]
MICAGEPVGLPPSHAVVPELYATGFEFAEGPALDDAGNLYVVNYRGLGKIGRIAPDGTAAVYCDLREREPPPAEGRKAQANGLKIDAADRLIVADAGGGRVLRIALATDGKRPKIEVLADKYEGKPLDAPNDVALDLAGNVYFSDPGSSNAERPTGSIYRIAADDGRITRLDAGLAYPNGLAVAPDQKRLCLAEYARCRLLIYDLTSDGRAENRRVLIEFTDKSARGNAGGPPGPDGVIFDAAGRLYAAMWTGGVINVVDVASGKLLRQYDAGGSQATNCHFHGGWLYTTIAAKEAVFRLKLGIEGFDYRGKTRP